MKDSAKEMVFAKFSWFVRYCLATGAWTLFSPRSKFQVVAVLHVARKSLLFHKKFWEKGLLYYWNTPIEIFYLRNPKNPSNLLRRKGKRSSTMAGIRRIRRGSNVRWTMTERIISFRKPRGTLATSFIHRFYCEDQGVSTKSRSNGFSSQDWTSCSYFLG